MNFDFVFRNNDRAAVSCPNCGGFAFPTLDRKATRAAFLAGAKAGAGFGLGSVINAAEAGAIFRTTAGPLGAFGGDLLGALTAASIGAAFGGAAGRSLGAAIDDAAVQTRVCLKCKHISNQ